jgi:hypothetical protein
MRTSVLIFTLCLSLIAGHDPARAQDARGATTQPAPATRPARPTPPTRRSQHARIRHRQRSYRTAPSPPPNADGNFIIGPTHKRAPEATAQDNVPHGTIHEFTMSSADSMIYPGIAREPDTHGTPDPNDPRR